MPAAQEIRKQEFDLYYLLVFWICENQEKKDPQISFFHWQITREEVCLQEFSKTKTRMAQIDG